MIVSVITLHPSQFSTPQARAGTNLVHALPITTWPQLAGPLRVPDALGTIVGLSPEAGRISTGPSGRYMDLASMIVGSGQFKYRVIAEWAKLPDGWSFKEVGGVGVNRRGNVYVFNRGDHPMILFDREGNFLRSWGEGQYPRAHGVHRAPDDTMFLTDDGGHFVRNVENLISAKSWRKNSGS